MEASYQRMFVPDKVVKSAMVEAVYLQKPWFKFPVGAIGVSFTTIATVEVASPHGEIPRTVYVIVAVPAPTAKISPVNAFTVATVASDVVHVPPVTVDEALVELPEQRVEDTTLAVPASAA